MERYKTLINFKTNTKTEPTSIIVDDELINESKNIANEYNNYFSAIANNLRGKIYKRKNTFESFLWNKMIKAFLSSQRLKKKY